MATSTEKLLGYRNQDAHWIEVSSTGTHYYLSRYLDQETAKWPFRSSSQAATFYYQANHSKVE